MRNTSFIQKLGAIKHLLVCCALLYLCPLSGFAQSNPVVNELLTFGQRALDDDWGHAAKIVLRAAVEQAPSNVQASRLYSAANNMASTQQLGMMSTRIALLNAALDAHERRMYRATKIILLELQRLEPNDMQVKMLLEKVNKSISMTRATAGAPQQRQAYSSTTGDPIPYQSKASTSESLNSRTSTTSTSYNSNTSNTQSNPYQTQTQQPRLAPQPSQPTTPTTPPPAVTHTPPPPVSTYTPPPAAQRTISPSPSPQRNTVTTPPSTGTSTARVATPAYTPKPPPPPPVAAHGTIESLPLKLKNEAITTQQESFVTERVSLSDKKTFAPPHNKNPSNYTNEYPDYERPYVIPALNNTAVEQTEIEIISSWRDDLRVKRVVENADKSIIQIGTRAYRLGEIVLPEYYVFWRGLNPQTRTLYFVDRRGHIYKKRY